MASPAAVVHPAELAGHGGAIAVTHRTHVRLREIAATIGHASHRLSGYAAGVNPVTRNGLIWLCIAAAAAVLWLASPDSDLAPGFKVVAVLVTLVGLGHVAWGLARD